MAAIRTYIFFLSIFICISSCKTKGCRDEGAINFDITAESDDGSCAYCELQSEIVGMETVFVYDYNSDSPYFNQAIAKCVVIQELKNYNSSSCGESGCFLEADVTNLTKHQMENFSFHLYMNPPNTFLTFLFTSYSKTTGGLFIEMDSTIRVVNTNLDNTGCESISGASVGGDMLFVTYR